MTASVSQLVSVMMPYYNAGSKIEMALASLTAQTYSNWECIIVDDGSQLRPDEFVEKLNDARIRVLRHERNLGRGAARQTALENCTGEFLTFLDADDWMFPEKLEVQVKALNENPRAVACGHSLVIVDANSSLVGYWPSKVAKEMGPGSGPEQAIVNKLRFVDFPFVSAMYRMHAAKQARYDTSLLRAQDMDFFLQTAFRRQVTILPRALYAYTGWSAPSLRKSVESLTFQRLIYKKHKSLNPLAAHIESVVASLKIAGYKVLHKLMLDRLFYNRRLAPVDGGVERAYEKAKAGVVSTLRS